MALVREERMRGGEETSSTPSMCTKHMSTSLSVRSLQRRLRVSTSGSRLTSPLQPALGFTGLTSRSKTSQCNVAAASNGAHAGRAQSWRGFAGALFLHARIRFARSQHREVMAGLGLEPEGHVGVVPGHHLVQEAPGLHWDALALRLVLALGVPAPLVGLLGITAQAQLPHDAPESLPHVVLHGGGRLDELAVEDSGADAALWK